MWRHTESQMGETWTSQEGRSDLPLTSCSFIVWQEQCWDGVWGKGCECWGNVPGSERPCTQTISDRVVCWRTFHCSSQPALIIIKLSETGHWAGWSHAATPGTFYTICWIACFSSQADELFSLTVNIKVSSFSSMRAAVTYTYPMYCSYASWASREIVCEENYMEVKTFPLKVRLHPSSLPGTTISPNSFQKLIVPHVPGIKAVRWYLAECVSVDLISNIFTCHRYFGCSETQLTVQMK